MNGREGPTGNAKTLEDAAAYWAKQIDENLIKTLHQLFVDSTKSATNGSASVAAEAPKGKGDLK